MSDPSSTHPYSEPICPACNETSARRSFSKDGFDHYECAACAMLFLHPVPTQEVLSEHYRGGGDDDEVISSQCWEGDELDFRHYEAIWAKVLDLIERRAGRGPLLDVGCGGGQFLAFARSRNWDELEGIEISESAASAAHTRSGARIRSVDFLGDACEPGRYAAVTMWNVLEHVASPMDFVRQAGRLLRVGGVFAADCPNRHGITLRGLGARARVVMPPEHVGYFSRAALEQLLQRGGLRPLLLESNTIYLNNWVQFLGRTREGEETRRAYRSWYHRLTSSGLMRGGIASVNVFLKATDLGDQLLLAAARPPG